MEYSKKEKIKLWWNDFRVILAKDITSTRRVRKYFFSSIIPPLVLLSIFSLLFTIAMPESYKVVVVDEDNTSYSQEMLDYIKEIKSEFGPWFTVIELDSEAEARSQMEQYIYLGAIIIPDGFGDNVSEGNVATVDLVVQNINWDYPKNYMQRLDEAVLSYNQDHHTANGSISDFEIKLEKEYLIGDGTDLSMIRGIILGVVGFYGMIFGLLMGALNIAKEYDDETISEIINSPISKTAFIASKQMIGVVMGLISTLIIGGILFAASGVEFKGGFLGFILILITFCISTWIHANLGTLLGLKFKKVMPSIIISIVLSMVLWFFCGGMAPPIVLGEVVFIISRFIPGTYWNEILVAGTYFPIWSYIGIRLGILVLIGIITTILSWVIISKRGFSE